MRFLTCSAALFCMALSGCSDTSSSTFTTTPPAGWYSMASKPDPEGLKLLGAWENPGFQSFIMVFIAKGVPPAKIHTFANHGRHLVVTTTHWKADPLHVFANGDILLPLHGESITGTYKAVVYFRPAGKSVMYIGGVWPKDKDLIGLRAFEEVVAGIHED